MKTRLEEHYLTAVRPALVDKFGYKNVMQVPKLEKVVINMGVGEAVRDSKKLRTPLVNWRPLLVKSLL